MNTIAPLDPDSDHGRDMAERLTATLADIAQAIADRQCTDDVEPVEQQAA